MFYFLPSCVWINKEYIILQIPVKFFFLFFFKKKRKFKTKRNTHTHTFVYLHDWRHLIMRFKAAFFVLVCFFFLNTAWSILIFVISSQQMFSLYIFSSSIVYFPILKKSFDNSTFTLNSIRRATEATWVDCVWLDSPSFLPALLSSRPLPSWG